MPVTVTVKWGKQKFENLELDTAEPVEVFKAQLFALTNVPPARQKIMGVKGGCVKVCADQDHASEARAASRRPTPRMSLTRWPRLRTTPTGRLWASRKVII